MDFPCRSSFGAFAEIDRLEQPPNIQIQQPLQLLGHGHMEPGLAWGIALALVAYIA